jgi:hypothetical protein
MIFFAFLSVGLTRSHISSHELVKLTRIDSCFFSIDCFFSFVFHYLVCLRVGLYYFIQFVLYEVILLLWLSYKFDMLTQVRFFHLFLKLIFLICFELFFYIKLSCFYLIFVLLSNKNIFSVKKRSKVEVLILQSSYC